MNNLHTRLTSGSVPPAVAAIQAVLDLHSPEYSDPEHKDYPYCPECEFDNMNLDWPCPTVKAITTAMEAEMAAANPYREGDGAVSTWGELFNDRLADAGYLAPAIDEAGDHVTLVDAPVGEVERIMRETLLSDEAVLRALNAEEPRAATDNLADWGEQSVARIRAALTAALGEDEDDE